MFFVAFYQRQKRIISVLESKEKGSSSRLTSEPIIAAGQEDVTEKQVKAPYPPNVDVLETEITLDI